MDSIEQGSEQEESLVDVPPSVSVGGESYESRDEPVKLIVLEKAESGVYLGLEKVLRKFGIHVRLNARSTLYEIYFPDDFHVLADVRPDGDRQLGEYLTINGDEISRDAFEGFTSMKEIHAVLVHQLLVIRVRTTDANGALARCRGWSSGEVFKQLRAIGYNNSYDPLKEWMVSNAELNTWDGKPRLENLFFDYGLDPKTDSVTDNVGLEDYLSWAGKATFLVQAYRAFREPYKWDIVFILNGPQGCGKQTFLSRLVPRWGRYEQGLFRSYGKLVTGGEEPDRKNVQNLLGASLVELDEMGGVSTNNADGKRVLKAFISRMVDFVTLKYERQADYLPRKFLLFASMNDDGATGIPADSSGLRRFAPIMLDGGSYDGIVAKLTDDEVNQMWAEAYHLMVTGESPMPSPEIERIAFQLALGIENVDPMTFTILDAAWEMWNKDEPITTQTVAKKVNLIEPNEPISGSVATRVGIALKREFKDISVRHGSEYKGIKTRRYYEPKEERQ